MSAVQAFTRTAWRAISEPTPAMAILQVICLLPFLSPFSLEWNIVLHSILVVLIATFGVTYAVFSKSYKWSLPRSLTILLGIYVFWLLLRLVLFPNWSDAFGSSYLRLGIFPLIACITCGVLLLSVDTLQVLRWLYISSVGVCMISLSQLDIHAGHIERLRGLFQQADLLAVWLAVAFLLGFALWQSYPQYRKLLIASQGLLLATLFLTQTRAVILLLVAICFLIAFQTLRSTRQRYIVFGALAVGTVLALALFHGLQYLHVIDTRNTPSSITYRLDLQSYALRASTQQPLWGFGAGHISMALRCEQFKSDELQHTCHTGFYFNSSHNIYLDRILASGYIGGVLFFVLVVSLLRRGFQLPFAERNITYAALLIAAYYWTNVTSVEIELLLWILLLRPYAHAYEK